MAYGVAAAGCSDPVIRWGRDDFYVYHAWTFVSHREAIEGIDPDIAPIVQALREHGVDTFSSCQGGEGHAYAEPTVAFHGVYAEGFRALSVAIALMLPVRALRRVWRVSSHDEPEGPIWEMTFSPLRIESAND